MRFLDEVVINLVSGNGGKGCVSFRRERFIPKGGPNGGDGGKGGDIIIRASKRLHTLYDFSSKRHIRSQNGRPGRGKNQTGKDGADTIIEVPLGTLVYDQDTGDLLADLIEEGHDILIVPGGKGGKGNSHFATSTNRAPRFAQPGIPGQRKRIRLSLKYIADIGLIGLPNVGKSTLLSRLTSAQPKIDNYPFTTIIPNLGVIEYDDQNSLILADIPGLIKGASEGKGLGHHFLKHVERTRFMLHLIDITCAPAHHLLEDFYILQDELEKYSPLLTKKEQMVLINKIDLVSSNHDTIKEMMSALSRIGLESLPISALTGEGLDVLKQTLERKFIRK
ncbi:MAG: GTPase ObgE [Deltaproteobacteria bacterium RBG_19FT_COMBO_46_9]|nr:MAG: GTPase ObgE [Deltaproteobacteria bacterium RBG_19FT_COMBO_46_9]